MAHKELKFNEDARRALERGVNTLADAVKAGAPQHCSTLVVSPCGILDERLSQETRRSRGLPSSAVARSVK